MRNNISRYPFPMMLMLVLGRSQRELITQAVFIGTCSGLLITQFYHASSKLRLGNVHVSMETSCGSRGFFINGVADNYKTASRLRSSVTVSQPRCHLNRELTCFVYVLCSSCMKSETVLFSVPRRCFSTPCMTGT